MAAVGRVNAACRVRTGRNGLYGPLGDPRGVSGPSAFPASQAREVSSVTLSELG